MQKLLLILTILLIFSSCADGDLQENSKHHRRPASTKYAKITNNFAGQCQNQSAVYMNGGCYCESSKDYINPYVNSCQ